MASLCRKCSPTVLATQPVTTGTSLRYGSVARSHRRKGSSLSGRYSEALEDCPSTKGCASIRGRGCAFSKGQITPCLEYDTKMLQQILDQMWIDPELLVELDETQKQTLFCKMREEQVRRWKLWDAASSNNSPHPGTRGALPPALQPMSFSQIWLNLMLEIEAAKEGAGAPVSKKVGREKRTGQSRRESVRKTKKRTKKVDFLLGEDGEPWTWVMGEHPDDKSIEQILEEEAREAARLMAEKEAQSLRLSVVEAELTELLALNKRQMEEIECVSQRLEPEDIYCSADELRLTTGGGQSLSSPAHLGRSTKRDALQEISFNKQPGQQHGTAGSGQQSQAKVSQRVAQWERRLMEERTTEHFNRLVRKKQEALKEAEEAENSQEQLWREQQRKAKEAEEAMREVARRAREEHRRSIMEATSPTNNRQENPLDKIGFPKPPNKDAIVEWFRSSQAMRRAGLESNTNSIAPWFHGLISRQEAESLLSSQPAGSFLVRVSERIWGYAISYRDRERIKHYLIDASSGTYQFLGNNQKAHPTLGDLIKYHALKPITAEGGELLGQACQRAKPLPPAFQPVCIRAR